MAACKPLLNSENIFVVSFADDNSWQAEAKIDMDLFHQVNTTKHVHLESEIFNPLTSKDIIVMCMKDDKKNSFNHKKYLIDIWFCQHKLTSKVKMKNVKLFTDVHVQPQYFVEHHLAFITSNKHFQKVLTSFLYLSIGIFAHSSRAKPLARWCLMASMLQLPSLNLLWIFKQI